MIPEIQCEGRGREGEIERVGCTASTTTIGLTPVKIALEPIANLLENRVA